MKKVFLLNLFATIFCLTGVYNSNAQKTSALEIMGARLIVHTPTSVAGIKGFTYSSENATGTWGRVLDTSWYKVDLVKPTDFPACGGKLDSGVYGRWALILRGDCQFGTKAKNAQAAGAKGVII